MALDDDDFFNLPSNSESILCRLHPSFRESNAISSIRFVVIVLFLDRFDLQPFEGNKLESLVRFLIA